jgi:pSer/pThr/pTyr-binding forkhead associated (FHA) protein
MTEPNRGVKMSGNDSQQERHVLVINDGKRRAIALDAAAYSIGRDSSNAIVLNADTVSRQHAMLLRVPVPGTRQYRYRLIDGNTQGKPSANGVFVGNNRCQSHDLANCDTVRFGKTIEASYLMVSMGEAEFAQYLESISFQSLKSDTVNAKETLVAGFFDDEDLDFNVGQTTVAVPKETATERRPTVVPWAETVHEEPQPAPAAHKSPYRLWMLLIPAVLLITGTTAGIWVASSLHLPQPTAAPAATTTPQLEQP